jgi:hypothetical protein
MPPGLECLDFDVSADGTVRIELVNGMGVDITDMTVSVETECSPSGTVLEDGAIQMFTCQATPGSPGDQYRQMIQVSYTNAATGMPHTAKGEITAGMS